MAAYFGFWYFIACGLSFRPFVVGSIKKATTAINTVMTKWGVKIAFFAISQTIGQVVKSSRLIPKATPTGATIARIKAT